MAIRVLAAAALAAAATSPAADAALCIRLSTPVPRPVVGGATIIEMKTFVPLVSGALDPWIVSGYPFRIEAVSPRGRRFRINVEPSLNPYAWRGTFRFTRVGVWTVRVRNFGPWYRPGCGEELQVRVRER